MSKVTEQLDGIEAKIIAESNKDRARGLGDMAIAEVIKDKLEEIFDRLDCMTYLDLCDIIDEQDEQLESQENAIEAHLGQIHFLNDRLNEIVKENTKLRKKNKRLKKKVKRLSAYIDEMETAE